MKLKSLGTPTRRTSSASHAPRATQPPADGRARIRPVLAVTDLGRRGNGLAMLRPGRCLSYAASLLLCSIALSVVLNAVRSPQRVDPRTKSAHKRAERSRQMKLRVMTYFRQHARYAVNPELHRDQDGYYVTYLVPQLDGSTLGCRSGYVIEHGTTVAMDLPPHCPMIKWPPRLSPSRDSPGFVRTEVTHTRRGPLRRVLAFKL